MNVKEMLIERTKQLKTLFPLRTRELMFYIITFDNVGAFAYTHKREKILSVQRFISLTQTGNTNVGQTKVSTVYNIGIFIKRKWLGVLKK